MAESIMQKDKDCCYLCGRNGNGDPLEWHHCLGGAWKNEAMRFVKEYLESELADYRDQFVVIS